MIQSRQQKNKQSQYDPSHPYIPICMFLTFPASEQEYFIGKGKTMRRFLMQATAKSTYTPFQKEQYKKFIEYLQKNKSKLPKIIVDNPFWIEQWKMRWLVSQDYNCKNAVKAMEDHSKYLLTNRFDVTANAQKLLRQGVFYVCGRDAYYRPILVFDIDKMLQLDITQQELLQSQKFFFQKVLNFYLLPGQIQTWVAIIDVGHRNLGSLVSPMKSSIGFLSNTFRNRMKICYVVRIPGSLSFVWRIIKYFLKEDTAQKINFIDQGQIKHLLQYANPSQIQTKYGGTQPQIKQFWPPRTVQRLQQLNLMDFSHPRVKKVQITPQQYQNRVQNDLLKGHKISNKLMQIKKPIQQLKQPKLNANKENISIQKQQKYFQNISNFAWPKQCTPTTPPLFTQDQKFNWTSLLF